MSKSLLKRASPLLLAVLVAATLALGGCAEKARTLQVGAAQFETESLAAIDRIDDLRRQELAAPPVSDAEAMANFVRFAGNADVIREDSTIQDSEKRVRFEAQYRRLKEVEAEEARLTRAVMEQCLKAVIVGRELRSLIIRYDKLSVDDIANGLSTALSLAGQATGRDLSSLSNRTGEVVASINADPDLKVLLDTAIGEAQTALTK